MTAQRNRAVLFGCAAILSGFAAPPASAAPRRPVARAEPAMLPASADIEPGGAGPVAAPRLVADPGSVLDTYAPVRGVGAAAVEPPPSNPPTPAAPVTPAALMAAPAAGTGGPDPVVEAHSPPDAPILGAAAILNAAALQGALDAWVGPEPLRGLRSFPAALAEERRHDARAAVRAFYEARGFVPLWIVGAQFGAPARAALSRIDRAAEDGLDLRAVPVSVPNGEDPQALAAAELSLTEAAVEYARQAGGGRIDPSRIGDAIAAKPEVASPAQVLSAMRDAADAGDALRAFNPPHPGYAALRAKLAELRRGTGAAERAPLPGGPALHVGMSDARVPLVRARFGLDIAAEGHDLVYDTRVASAVAGFQRAHGLPASGALTARTVASLSGGRPKRLEDEIVANMERWRWLPRDLGSRYVAVNIPDFSLDVVEDGRTIHHARVVVGKPDHETPVFSETMRYVIVNPYWNVPLSIVEKEMMPKLAADPNYFADHGYEVVRKNGETYVRQPPGDSNALGRIKFLFPNRFSVYLHDTNAKSYFARDVRALSHGCVRVDQPFKLAEAVLGRDRGWTEARVAAMVGGGERTINLPRPVQVHINYFTAFVDETGQIRLRDDVYGYSAKVRTALGLTS